MPTNSLLVNEQLFFWLVVAVAVCNTLGLIFFWVVMRNRVEHLLDALTGGSFLQNLTVIVVVQTVGLLALAGVLSGELVATLLGGIVGYVLGSIKTSRNNGE